MEKGELIIANMFCECLPPDWEIYIQPYLNGLRPDFVLLHPRVGIAVFEVKDWDLDALEYYITSKNGVPHLMASDGVKHFSRQKDNPVDKVYRYKKEIYDLYCPSLPKEYGLEVISAGIIFPFADDEKACQLLEDSLKYHSMYGNKDLYPVSGRNAIKNRNIENIFPRSKWRRSDIRMNEDAARDARRWLDEPDFHAEQRRHLLEVILDKKQKDIITDERQRIAFRRIKGTAGSGKSLVLAARAAELSLRNKQVLVVTYNITLMNYLSDLAVRWYGGAARRNITWFNFHEWCRIVMEETNHMSEYQSLWVSKNDNDIDDILHNKLPNLVNQCIMDDNEHKSPRYDAILVDEGQDFRPLWWNVLRKVLKENGEMILAADYTQDIYETSKAWTEDVMRGCGFIGSWNIMNKGYRLPPLLSARAGDFAKSFIPNYPEIAPRIPDEGNNELLLFPCVLKWIQIDDGIDASSTCCEEACKMIFGLEENGLTVADMTILVDNRELGAKIEQKLKKNNIKSTTTFSIDSKEEQRKKRRFYMGSPMVKITTIHSFKGWESRALILYVKKANSDRDKALIYTAMTRLKRNDQCCFLTVICNAPNLKSYGKTWKGDYMEISSHVNKNKV